jgi:DNA-binding CsgD family transcriptional regulator
MGSRMLQGHHLSIMETQTVDDYRSQVIRFARSLEFDTVNALVVIDHSATHKGFYYVDNTPEPYLETWKDASLFGLDPVMQHCKRSSVPIVWDQETYVSNGQGALWEQQAAYGFRTGIGVTLHLPGDEHFFIGVDRDMPLTANARALTRVVADLQLFAVHARDAGKRLLVPTASDDSSAASPSLTPRELETLRWTMDGKLAWEIGELLNISERTAVFHLQNAARKLGCNSKFQAVLKAIRLGLLA